MFQFFRNFFKTKLGLAISLAFLGLIALAFASADVSSTGTFGGIAGGDCESQRSGEGGKSEGADAGHTKS